MRETNFIKQKHEKWMELERTMKQAHPDPDQLNDLFIQITDDLSYSRTYYPNRSVRVYLNGLAQRIFYSIYKNKKKNLSSFASFWTHDLPLILFDYRRTLLVGMLLFWLPFLLGCLSGSMGGNEEFARQMLGDEYIDMTLANIQSGDPMAVYKDQSRFTMSLFITLNNLVVCLRDFMFGALFTLGSMAQLVFFGLYVGAFQFFFYEQGELTASILGVWTHGSLEIPAIILCCTAGIVLGSGLVFPGAFSRGQAFLMSAKKGIRILVGTIPLIFIAGFLEGYVTRLTDTPDFLRAGFITFNFTMVLFYFVWLPLLRGCWNFSAYLPRIIMVGLALTGLSMAGFFALGMEDVPLLGIVCCPAIMYLVTEGFSLSGVFQKRERKEQMEALPAPMNGYISLSRIKSAGEIFTDACVLYRKFWRPIARAALGGAALFIGGVLLLAKGSPGDLFSFPDRFGDMGETLMDDLSQMGLVGGLMRFYVQTVLDILEVAGQFFNYEAGIPSPYFITNILIYTTISHVALRGVKYFHARRQSELPDKIVQSQRYADFFKIMAVVAAMNLQLLLGANASFFYFSFFATFPIMLLWMVTCVLEQAGLFSALGRAVRLAFTRIGNGLVLYMILGNICLMILALVYSPVMMLLLQHFGYNFVGSEEGTDQLLVLTLVFICQMMYGFIVPLIVLGYSMYYYSQSEIKDAKSLMRDIQLIGTRKRLRGLERE